VEVGGIVLELILVDLGKTGVELQAVLVNEDLRLVGVLQPWIEECGKVIRASLQDGNERKPLVLEALGNDVVEEVWNPIHRLGNEGYIGHA
jgi:hypothetical protein